MFVAPTEAFWRLDKPATHRDGPLPEQFSWEVERFCALALQANPTVLECLWSPITEVITPFGERLVAMRGAFLSARAQQTFARYAEAQFRRIDPAAPKWKQAMHMIRLLRGGLHLVRHGDLMIDVGDDRERLLAVRRGEVSWPEVVAWHDALLAELDSTRCALPATPGKTAVDDFLIDVRRAHL